MKLLVKILLSLFFVLFCGSCQLLANSYNLSQIPSVTVYTMVDHCTPLSDCDENVVKSGSPSHERQDDRIDDREEKDDDDEPTSLRKPVACLNYYSSFYSLPKAGYQSRCPKKRLSFYKHFSYTATDTHIVFRVIRI